AYRAPDAACDEGRARQGTLTMLVKICANTTLADARLAVDAGADYVGVIVDHSPSPRNLSLSQAQALSRELNGPLVAVSVNLSLAHYLRIADTLQPAALQLHGDEPATL